MKIPALKNIGTPSLSGKVNKDGLCVCKTGGTTTITNLLDAAENTRVVLISEHAVQVTHGAATIVLAGGVNVTLAAKDILHLVKKADGYWYETGRVVALATASVALAAYGTGAFGFDSDANCKKVYDGLAAVYVALKARGIMT